jgi:tetratricopeptide (TPR) repeat protein
MSEGTAASPLGRGLKIAVYGICLNEEAFVDRFMDSCADADLVVIADTGSTDGTVEAFRRRGAIVHSIAIRPWRFDHARQAALELTPEDVDICVSLDLDQVLQPGWRALLDQHWTPPTNQATYTLLWGRNHDGSPRRMLDNRIHARHGFRWRYPVHECILPEGVDSHLLVVKPLRIDHLPDDTKSRSQYLGLLELAAREEPDLPRHAHFLAREYFILERYGEAIAAFERHIAMGGDGLERNMSLRTIGECKMHLGDPEGALSAFRQAAEEMPDLRGSLTDYAWALYRSERWAECFEIAARASALDDRTSAYGVRTETGVLPEDMAAICGWRLGRLEQALAYGRMAMRRAPGVERIRRNVEQMEAALAAANPPASQQTAGGVLKLG